MSEHVDKLRAQLHHAHAHGPSDETLLVLEMMEVVVEAIDAIQIEFDQYKQVVAEAFTAIDTALSNFAGRVTELSNEIAAAGGNPAKAAALAADITTAQGDATAELAKVQAADPGTVASGGASGSGAGGGLPTGGTSVTTPNYYTFDGDPTTVAAPWQPTTLETVDPAGPPKSLFTNSNDVLGQPSTIALGTDWHVYSGPTAAVPTT
jgi:hypothetical protein